MTTDAIELDGSEGEGGGQILRTALGLSVLTGRPFRISRIRGLRKKPGLMRQHLTCVRAATRIGAAEVTGDDIGSCELTFRPQAILPGRYELAIDGAGSTTLVLQTVLPALMSADAPSKIVIRGGTHNPLAPTFDFLDRVFFRVLRGMGVGIEARLLRHGFFPVGGGAIEVDVTPAKRLDPFELLTRGPLTERRATILLSGIPEGVAERERDVLHRKLQWPHDAYEIVTPDSAGPGNVVSLEVGDGHVREIVTAFGARGVRAEVVARAAARDLAAYVRDEVPVGIHLANQLLIPMALAGGGAFRTSRPSLHTRTNAEMVERFLPVGFRYEEESERGVTVAVRRDG